MELNINSPTYFTQQYGVNEGVYYYCKKCHEYFKYKEYSEILKVIGICPQCAPKDLYQKGMWKEKVRFIGNGSCASVDIRIDFDQYYNATDEEKLIIRNTVIRAVKKSKQKASLIMKGFTKIYRMSQKTNY